MRFKRVTSSLIAKKEAEREYRKRNVVFFALFLGWIPFSVFIAVPLGKELNADWLSETLIFGWFLAIFVSAIWRLNWECPRCNKSFYKKWWYNNAAAMRCVNCGYKPGE